MSQHDYTIANQGFPATRADINNALSAIATNNSGTSAPSTQYAGQFWIDTTSSTWTLYIHDGTDDIQFATIDTSANTVNFTDSALDVVTDTTPQLGGDLDANGNNILFDDGTGINDDDDNELIRFQKIASAVNQIDISNSATGNAPEISATGDDTNIDLNLTPKGTGKLVLDGLNFPTADGTTGQFLKTDGSGNLSFDDVGVNTPAFAVKFTANYTLTVDTIEIVQFSSEFYDTDSAFNTSTYKFTVPAGKAGKYFFHAQLYYTNGIADGKRGDLIFDISGTQLNGTVPYTNNTVGSATDIVVNGSMVKDLSVGDTVAVYSRQNDDSSAQLFSGASFFYGYKLIGA